MSIGLDLDLIGFGLESIRIGLDSFWIGFGLDLMWVEFDLDWILCHCILIGFMF